MAHYKFNRDFVRNYSSLNPVVRLCLWFQPLQCGFDFGYSRSDCANMVFYKTWRGRVYLIRTISQNWGERY